MSVKRNDEYFMRHALELAGQAFQHGEVPVGAIVVIHEEVIGEGANAPIALNDPTAHAEIMALRDAATRSSNYRLPDCTLYVTIEPCTMCVGAMVHARIARVVFGAKEPKAGVLGSNGCILEQGYWNHRMAWVGGVLAEEAGQLMRAFFRSRREEARIRKLDSPAPDGV